MTGPAVIEDNAVSLEEMEATSTSDAPATPAPDAPTVEKLLEDKQKLETALRLSELERTTAQNRPAPVAAPVAAVPMEDYHFSTREELQAMYEENPLAAVEKMNNDALVRADRHLAARFGGIESSVASTQEASARQRYADEFKVLGPEINALVAQIPDKRVLNDPRSWDDLVTYVRGQNFDKMYEYKVSGGQQPRTPESARAEQAASSGFSPRPTERSTPAQASPTTLDSTQARIADVMGLSPAEYIKWSKMGVSA